MQSSENETTRFAPVMDACDFSIYRIFDPGERGYLPSASLEFAYFALGESPPFDYDPRLHYFRSFADLPPSPDNMSLADVVIRSDPTAEKKRHRVAFVSGKLTWEVIAQACWLQLPLELQIYARPLLQWHADLEVQGVTYASAEREARVRRFLPSLWRDKAFTIGDKAIYHLSRGGAPKPGEAGVEVEYAGLCPRRSGTGEPLPAINGANPNSGSSSLIATTYESLSYPPLADLSRYQRQVYDSALFHTEVRDLISNICETHPFK